MSLIIYFLWTVLAVITAFLFLKAQSWSVKLVSPKYRRLSHVIVIGGALIRWSLIFSILFLALSYSVLAMLLVFVVFMLTRMLILFRWTGELSPGQNKLL